MVNLTPEILLQTAKPARYIGNEMNMVVKDPLTVDIRFAFCFPDVYDIGMSHLGMHILYYFLNQRDDTYCERVYAPWNDMEQLMRKNNILLYGLETKDEIKDFDFVAFTLQYEMSYTNILNMLDLAQIPLFRKDRSDGGPLVVCGGPGAYNPEPLADYVDFFYIGEGEVLYNEILDLYKQCKPLGKQYFLEQLLSIEGVYVPQFYDVAYKENGEIESFRPNHKDAKEVIRKVIVKDFDQVFYPEKMLVPFIEIVHDRTALEVFRGCSRGCRFCQAGFVYRPVREKKSGTLLSQAKKLLASSGYDEISLLSLSTGDYSQFHELTKGIIDEYLDKKVNISLPSLRIDAFHLEIMKKIQSVRKSSITFAPEAGSQRLRDVINKNITEEEIVTGCRLVFSGGWNRVKLYFMLGLPTENFDDLEAIALLAEKIVKTYYEYGNRNRPPSIVISNSCFVPKPFTPFQWDAQDNFETFIEKAGFVKKHIKRKQIKYNYHEAKVSVIEGALARGDRRLSSVLYHAWRLGCKFDGWSEYFDFDKWKEAFARAQIDYRFYAERKRSYEEILPWDFISVGVSKAFLRAEREKAQKEDTTPSCRESCSGCGISQALYDCVSLQKEETL